MLLSEFILVDTIASLNYLLEPQNVLLVMCDVFIFMVRLCFFPFLSGCGAMVAHQLPKLRVAGSNPVARSIYLSNSPVLS